MYFFNIWILFTILYKLNFYILFNYFFIFFISKNLIYKKVSKIYIKTVFCELLDIWVLVKAIRHPPSKKVKIIFVVEFNRLLLLQLFFVWKCSPDSALKTGVCLNQIHSNPWQKVYKKFTKNWKQLKEIVCQFLFHNKKVKIKTLFGKLFGNGWKKKQELKKIDQKFYQIKSVAKNVQKNGGFLRINNKLQPKTLTEYK